MRRHLLLLALLASALVGVALLAVPGSPLHHELRKGLDLQGGLEVVLEAKPKDGHRPTAEDLDRSIAVMRERIDKLGVSEPELRKQGSNQIVIQLPAVHDPDEAAAIVGKTAQLELYDLEPSLPARPSTRPETRSPSRGCTTSSPACSRASGASRARTGSSRHARNGCS